MQLMQKHYFGLDTVVSITLTLESETALRWYPAIPAIKKSFMRISGYPEIPAGWNEFIDNHGNEYNFHSRKPTSYFADYDWYRVCDINKRIYRKAHILIKHVDKRAHEKYFESNEDAQNYVDDFLRLHPEKKFVLL